MDIDLSTDLDAFLPMSRRSRPGTPTSPSAPGSWPGRPWRVARSVRLISRTYNLMVRAMFATQVRDLQCGFKAVRPSGPRPAARGARTTVGSSTPSCSSSRSATDCGSTRFPVDWTDDPDSQGRRRPHRARGRLRVRCVSSGASAPGGGRVASPPPVGRGRRLRAPVVSFGLIGPLSTVTSLLLFLALRTRSGRRRQPRRGHDDLRREHLAQRTFTLRAARPGGGVPARCTRRPLALSTMALLVAIGAVGLGPVGEVLMLCGAWAVRRASARPPDRYVRGRRSA